MTTQAEAFKLALKALETSARNWPSDSVIEAITAIKEVLAQPEQERCVGCEACIDTACGRDECPKGWPKAAQPEQEPVAYCDIHHLPEPCVQCAKEHEGYNIPPQPKEPEQEPVARVDFWPHVGGGKHISNMVNWRHLPVGALLYTTQPQRKPLTDEFLRKLHHIDQFRLFCDYDDFEQISRAIEAAHGIKE